MDQATNYENLTPEELDRLLFDTLNRLSREKRAYLLEWIKKEFPDTVDT